YDGRTLGQVATLLDRHPGVRVYAADRFADWLLWHEPALEGRVAYDSRLELLTGQQLLSLATLTEIRALRERDPLDGYPVMVLEAGNRTSKLLLGKPHTRVALRGRD